MNVKKYLRLLILSIIFLGSIIKVGIASDPELNTKGLVLSIETPKGNKGIILPSVKLEKLDTYAPIAGNPIIGMLVESTTSIGDITSGIYRWNGQSWTKLIDKIDTSLISQALKS